MPCSPDPASDALVLHRCLQRHEISRLPQVEGEASAKRKFKAYPIGYFHIDIAEVRTAQGKLYLLVAIDRTSKFAFVEMHEKVARRTAGDFLRRLIAAVPYKVPTVLTDNGTHFTTPGNPSSAAPDIKAALEAGELVWAHASRKNEPHHQGRDCQTLLLRHPRPAASPPAKLRRRLQLRQTAQNPQRPHPIRIHLQSLDFRPSQIQNQPAPANAGTNDLGRCVMKWYTLPFSPPPA